MQKPVVGVHAVLDERLLAGRDEVIADRHFRRENRYLFPTPHSEAAGIEFTKLDTPLAERFAYPSGILLNRPVLR